MQGPESDALQLLHDAHDVRQPARRLPVLSTQHLRAASGVDGALYIFLLHAHAGRDEAAAAMHWLVLQPELHQDFDRIHHRPLPYCFLAERALGLVADREQGTARSGTLQSHVQGTAAARLRAAAKLRRHSELCAHKTHARQSTCRRLQLRCKLAAHLHAGHGCALCPQLEAVQVHGASAGPAQTV